jgi:cation:H+ antiporter
VLIGLLLLGGGVLLVLWGAEKFTDGAIRTAARFALSPFYVGAVVSGFEPENLVIGGVAALSHLPQIALGTVIGSAVFMLTAGLGLTLLVVPMEVRIPRHGGLAMIASALLCAVVLWNDGAVSLLEGLWLVALAIGLMAWLSRASPVFKRSPAAGDAEDAGETSRVRVLALLLVGVVVMLVGAELVVRGVHALLASVRLSETFLGMVVIGMGESLEEAARMVTPARRGHPELAWGNVVGTTVVLLTFNLGAITLLHPPVIADPFVLRFHAPYVIVCVLLVAAALLGARKLGRGTGLTLVTLYVVYVAVSLSQMWQ